MSACAGGEATGDPDFDSEVPTFNGTPGTGSTPAPPSNTPGTNANGSQPGGTSTGNAPPSTTPVPAPGNEQTGGNGTPISGATPGNTSGNNSGTGTAPSGTGGTSGESTAPNGSGGTGMATAGTGNMPAPVDPPPVTPPPVTPPPEPAGPDIDCPANASFCSGFEGTAFPSGTQFHSVGPAAPMPFTFDTAEAFEGNQSLLIGSTGSGGFFYRALAVPVPAQDFWARLYVMVSSTFGDNSHDSLFGASSGALTADVNGEALVEFSEQFNEVLLNTDDALFNPPTTTTITPNVWHCMEAHYNGATGDVEVFSDGASIIAASGYRPLTLQTFRIGYMRYNEDRAIRYDNVVVAPARVGCN